MRASLLASRNPFVRKGTSALLKVPRALRRFTAKSEHFVAHPPALANSFPKSGTHLLHQVLGALPTVTDYGTFWASMPSVTFRERPASAMASRIGRLAPGELVAAHLFFDEALPPLLSERAVAHFFIVRDPRDVVVSEAFYLATMNRWHRLHRTFRDLPDLAERVSLSIAGATEPFPYDYPDVGRRFARYAPWLEQPGVLVLKFEDLIGERQRDWLVAIVRHAWPAQDAPPSAEAVDAVVSRVATAMDPHRSRTFRQGGAGGWRAHFTTANTRAMKEHAGDLLIRLGYESDLDW